MAEPIDATDIGDEDILWRRVDRHMIDKNFDGSESVQSFAYRDQNRELSAYLARETTAEVVLALGLPEQVLIEIQGPPQTVADPDDVECPVGPHESRLARLREAPTETEVAIRLSIWHVGHNLILSFRSSGHNPPAASTAIQVLCATHESDAPIRPCCVCCPWHDRPSRPHTRPDPGEPGPRRGTRGA